MSWDFKTNYAEALDALHLLAAKDLDPLQDDLKAIEDRAQQDAETVVSNLSNERLLAEQYQQSDKSKGLDKDSEFYRTIQQYAKDNFGKSKPQLDSVLAKYQDRDELASMVGNYYKAFEDHFFDKVTKAWQELRPTQTVNPTTAPAPEMAPQAARRSL